jgi:hypothetical protein
VSVGVESVWPEAVVQAAASIAASTNAIMSGRGRAGSERMDARGYQASHVRAGTPVASSAAVATRARR